MVEGEERERKKRFDGRSVVESKRRFTLFFVPSSSAPRSFFVLFYGCRVVTFDYLWKEEEEEDWARLVVVWFHQGAANGGG